MTKAKESEIFGDDLTRGMQALGKATRMKGTGRGVEIFGCEAEPVYDLAQAMRRHNLTPDGLRELVEAGAALRDFVEKRASILDKIPGEQFAVDSMLLKVRAWDAALPTPREERGDDR